MLWPGRNLVLCARDHFLLQWVVPGVLAKSRQRSDVWLHDVCYFVRASSHGEFCTDLLNLHRQLRADLLDMRRELRADLFLMHGRLCTRVLNMHRQLRPKLQHLHQFVHHVVRSFVRL